MKKLMLLAAMLAIVLAAAIPALAQNVEPATDVELGDGDELICLLPEGCDMNTGIGPVPVIGPAYNDIQPVPQDIEPVDCSEALEGSSIDRRAFDPTTGPDDTSVIPAEEPGCFAIPVPAPMDGDSVGHVYEYPDTQ